MRRIMKVKEWKTHQLLEHLYSDVLNLEKNLRIWVQTQVKYEKDIKY